MSEHRAKPLQLSASPSAGVMERYAPHLHRYLRRRVRNPATVPDLTQDVFERFLQVPSVETVRNALGFLYGIASHVVSEYHYRQAQSQVDFDSDAAEAAGEQLHNALPDESDRLAMQQELRRALHQLPPVHRVVLLLIKREGMSYAEAASKTGLEEATIKTYVYEARAKLKQLLKRSCPMERD